MPVPLRHPQSPAVESLKVPLAERKIQERIKTFTGWTAQIIQHEIDHCEGIII